MATKSILDFCEYDKRTQTYTEKIEQISLIHKTGLITARTSKDREFSVKITDLIPQLKVDQQPEIIKRKANVFTDIIKIKFCEKNSNELEKIIHKANLNILEIIKDPLFKYPIAIIAVRQIEIVKKEQKPISAFVTV